MVHGLGRDVEGEVHVDSSAALAAAGRKLIRVCQLWTQQVAEDETLVYTKACGMTRSADICTKTVPQHINGTAAKVIEMDIRDGRPQESLGIDAVAGRSQVVALPCPVVDPSVEPTWTRCDYGGKGCVPTRRDGPKWDALVRRIIRADGYIIEDIEVQNMKEKDMHRSLPRPAQVLETTLVYIRTPEEHTHKVVNWADALEDELAM